MLLVSVPQNSNAVSTTLSYTGGIQNYPVKTYGSADPIIGKCYNAECGCPGSGSAQAWCGSQATWPEIADAWCNEKAANCEGSCTGKYCPVSPAVLTPTPTAAPSQTRATLLEKTSLKATPGYDWTVTAGFLNTNVFTDVASTAVTTIIPQYSANCLQTDGTGTAQITFSTLGWTEVTVTADVAAASLEDTETCKTDLGATTLNTIGDGQEDKWFAISYTNAAALDGKTGLTLSLSGPGTAASADKCVLCNLAITGIPPAATAEPSAMPTFPPTTNPTARPSALPSAVPSMMPTVLPSALPTITPTTARPTATPTAVPSVVPSTAAPTYAPGTPRTFTFTGDTQYYTIPVGTQYLDIVATG